MRAARWVCARGVARADWRGARGQNSAARWDRWGRPRVVQRAQWAATWVARWDNPLLRWYKMVQEG